MALLYDSVREINPMKEKWSIKIKVIRLWTTPDLYNPENHYSIEMVFVDEKGDKIQATVKRSKLLRFGPILHEGSVYSISRFGVGQPSGDYRPTKHAYKLNFLSATIVEQLNELDMPISGYNFVCFRDILSNKLDDKYLVDVIGGVTEVEQRKNDDDDNSEICSNNFSTPNHKRVFQDLQDTNIKEYITPAELSTSKSRKVIVVNKEKDETEF
ncbi:Replication protein A 70 kDa DNA-binding subunit B [Bienertia sinuspersici]